MAFSKNFKTDLTLEEKGVWLQIGVDVDTGVAQEILVRYSANKDAQRMITRLREPHKKQFRKGNIPDDINETILTQVVAKHILIGWRGLLDDDGKEIEFTEEKALEILSDPAYKEFKADVGFASSQLESFRAEEVKEGSKNSETSSTGKRSGVKS